MDGMALEGLRYGRYEIVGMLGVGGMGRVLRARDPDLDRPVAIKVLREPGPEATARLLREARTMAALSHPNVVPIYDIDVDQDEVFIAMELVEGQTLRAWLQKRPPWRDVLAAFEQAARGLIAAHEAGLVHRDFKPDNVMLDADAQGDVVGRVRVMDFGLARASGTPSTNEDTERDASPAVWASGDDRLTQTGAVVGTPSYLAPEQEAGASATAASDQFSFCVALYEGLYGVRPFGGGSFDELSRQKWAARYEPPPADTPVPKRLLEVVTRGMRPDPSERWPSMEALIDALDQAQRPRNIGRAAFGAVGAAAVVGFLAAFGARDDGPACIDGVAEADRAWNPGVRGSLQDAFEASAAKAGTWASVEEPLDRFFTDWKARRAELCEAGDLDMASDRRRLCLDDALRHARAFVGVLSEADDEAWARAPDAVASLPDLDHCDEVHDDASRFSASARTDEVTGLDEVLAQVGALANLARYQAAAATLDEHWSELMALQHCPSQVEAMFLRGSIKGHLGDYADAAALLEATYYQATACEEHRVAVQAARHLLAFYQRELPDLERADQWFRHAQSQLPFLPQREVEEAVLRYVHAFTLERMGRPDEAMQEMATAGELLQPRAEEAPEVWGEYLTNRASLSLFVGDPEGAVRFGREAVEANIRAWGPDHPKVAMAHGNLAAAYHSMSRYDEAIEASEKTTALMKRAFGDDHPFTVRSQVSLAQVLSLVGRWDEAYALMDQALSTAEGALPDGSPDRLNALRTAAQMAVHRGEGDRALEYYRRLMNSQDEIGVRDGTYVFDLTKVAELLVSLGRFDEAERKLQDALELVHPQDDEHQGKIHATFAWLHHARGDFDRADASFVSAIAKLEPIAGGQTFDLAEVLEAHGDLLLDAGRNDEAAAVLERTLTLYRKLGVDPADLDRVAKNLSRAR